MQDLFENLKTQRHWGPDSNNKSTDGYEELKMPLEALQSTLREFFVNVAPRSLSHAAQDPSSVNANSDSMNLIGKLGRYLPRTNIEHKREKIKEKC